MTATITSLTAAVEANPADRTAWLVLADALQEAGRNAEAELIRRTNCRIVNGFVLEKVTPRRGARIGGRMAAVRFYCSDSPRAVIDVARLVGPHGSLQYGYETIKRAVRAGIVQYAPALPGRRGASIVATA